MKQTNTHYHSPNESTELTQHMQQPHRIASKHIAEGTNLPLHYAPLTFPMKKLRTTRRSQNTLRERVPSTCQLH